MLSNADNIHFNYANWRTVKQSGSNTLESFTVGRELREILSNSEKRISYFSSLGNIVNEILEHMASEGFHKVACFRNVLIVAPIKRFVSGYHTVGDGTGYRHRLYRSINRDDNCIASSHGDTIHVWFVERVTNSVTDDHDIEIVQGDFPTCTNVNMNRAFKVNLKEIGEQSILFYRGGENGRW